MLFQYVDDTLFLGLREQKVSGALGGYDINPMKRQRPDISVKVLGSSVLNML